MHFAFTSDQLLFRAALRELLEQHCTPAHVRAVFEGREPRVAELWARLSALGVIGTIVPAADGGSGLSEIELTLLLEESGRAALPEPLLETAVALPLLAAVPDGARARHWLQQALHGHAAVAVGWGDDAAVVNAHMAQVLLLARDGELHLVETDALQLTAAASVDGTRSLARVLFEPCAKTRLATGDEARRLLARARERATLGTAAELAGLAARMLELTTDYVKTREQFGRPVGAYQAVKHQLVDAYLALEFARPLLYRAAHSLAHDDPERALHVAMAKAALSDAAWLAARKSLQLHGALGYSFEYDLQLYMKRVWALAAAHGGGAEQRRYLAHNLLAD